MTVKTTISRICKSLLLVEKISIIYACLTALYIIILGAKENNAIAMILFRALFIALMFFLRYLNNKYSASPLIWLARNLFPLVLITYWYPETYYINENIFCNLDRFFVAADQWLFGCQPSLEFSKCCNQQWVSELMYFGYISYFVIITATVFISLARGKECMQRSVFLILCSFLIYYTTFIIFPVSGPQFYFSPPDNLLDCTGFFRNLMIAIQDLGEKPTGAFPSSHVGICCICMYILFKHSRKVFYTLAPVAIVLICSTVYIKAHYLIDVIGGFVSAPFYFWISSKIYK